MRGPSPRILMDGIASDASGRMLCQLSYRGTVLGGREL
jgi:hypothetical protein